MSREVVSSNGARPVLPPEGRIRRLAEFFRLFADPTRMKLLCALRSAELCVADLTELTGVSQSAVSHQLRLLRSAGAVKSRRSGKTVFYSLDDEGVSTLLFLGLEHLALYDDQGDENLPRINGSEEPAC